MIIEGNCLDKLKELENDSIDLVCTDPPYGYSFMGKDWDKAVPPVEAWEECLRVLKPGAFCMVMSAPRSDVQMHMVQNLTEAGFRLDFTPIYWTYASGFPKAGNIGKLVDKRLGAEREVIGEGQYNSRRPRATKETNIPGAEYGFNAGDVVTAPATDQAKALDGSYAGFQPKPAVEVILVAMKPLSEKTYVDQALKNGKGITWLDDCRVPTETGRPISSHNSHNRQTSNEGWKRPSTTTGAKPTYKLNSGRFPANLIVSDDVLNDGTVTKSPKTYKRNSAGMSTGNSGIGTIGEQAGKDSLNFGDSGSYSRYFDLDKWADTLPFLIVPKASKREKNEGLGESKNIHPTCKPLKLMSYLITLASRPGDIVLDPFCGSGTTCLAAKKLNREYIGIEKEVEYIEIANARLNVKVQGSLI